MLARIPKAAEMDFNVLLKIPPKPAAIAEAEQVWRESAAELEAARSKHREMHRQYFGQQPGMPPTITAAEVDQAGQEIAPFQAKEREAQQSLEAHRKAFDDELAALKPKIDSYRGAIAAKIDELEDLISVGAMFYAASIEARTKLPSKMPSRCEALLGPHCIGMLRKILNAVD